MSRQKNTFGCFFVTKSLKNIGTYYICKARAKLDVLCYDGVHEKEKCKEIS